jgi:hypothetical protein
MGCYPLFACRDWSQLHIDLETMKRGLISLALVADPFGEYDEAYLRRCFDLVTPFKEHFVVDLHRPINSRTCGHHQRYVRKSLRCVSVERCREPKQFLNEWVELYSTLIERHTIRGIATFSRASFEKQLEVPGLVMFRSLHEDATVGMILWYVQGDVGYYHLGAYSDAGYDVHASFALFWSALEYFADKGLRWINLGAGAGVTGNGGDGLSSFKRGWSTGTRSSYFCGRIFNKEIYTEIVKVTGTSATNYFPAYRNGEFG